MIVTGTNDAEMKAAVQGVKAQLAFYGSTPAYRPVLALHGWGELHTELNLLSKRGEWVQMAGLITDDIVDAFAVVGRPEEIPAKLLGSLRRHGHEDQLLRPVPDGPPAGAGDAGRIQSVVRTTSVSAELAMRRLRDEVDQTRRPGDDPRRLLSLELVGHTVRSQSQGDGLGLRRCRAPPRCGPSAYRSPGRPSSPARRGPARGRRTAMAGHATGPRCHDAAPTPRPYMWGASAPTAGAERRRRRRRWTRGYRRLLARYRRSSLVNSMQAATDVLNDHRSMSSQTLAIRRWTDRVSSMSAEVGSPVAPRMTSAVIDRQTPHPVEEPGTPLDDLVGLCAPVHVVAGRPGEEMEKAQGIGSDGVEVLCRSDRFPLDLDIFLWSEPDHALGEQTTERLAWYTRGRGPRR